MTRDQFLTEKMRNYTNINFSTWEGFGKLWEWAKEQEWWIKFWIEPFMGQQSIMLGMVDPNRFADSIARYLGFKEDV